MRRGALVLAIGFALLLSGCGVNQTFDMDGRQVAVPIPAGFKPTRQNMPPVFTNIAGRTLPSKGSMVEFYLTTADAQSFKSHENLAFLETRSVSYIRDGRDFTDSDFASLKVGMLAGGGSYMAKGAIAQNQEEQQQSQRTGDTPVLLSDAHFLGIFLNDGNAIGRAHLFKEHLGASFRTVIHAVVVIRARDKGVMLKCTSKAVSALDISRTEKQCADWAGTVVKANADP